MSDTKEYIKGDKHVHQAGSIMIKFAQYNVPEQKGDWKSLRVMVSQSPPLMR